MILWGRASSVNVQKVLWALEELGLAYEHRVVGGKYGGLDAPDFATLTPARRVPVLQDGDLALWESHTILRHLARKTGQLGAPEGPVDMWMEFGSTTLQPPFIGMFWQRVRMTRNEQDPAALERYLAGIEAALTILEEGFAGGRRYVAGAVFSIADIALGSLFFRLTDVYPESLAPVPKVAAWYKTIAARPAYAKWVATSYEELRVTS